MKILKTAFDIDGVIVHTWEPIERMLLEKYGIELKGKERESYRLETFIDREIVDDVITYALSRESAHEATIDEEAVYCMEALHGMTGKTIPFITARKNREDILYLLDNYVVKDKFPYILMMRQQFDVPSYTLKPTQMQELGCVAIVEDSPEVCKVVEEAGLIVLLVDRSYNQDCNPTVRFTDEQWDLVYHLCMITECKYKGERRYFK